MLYFSYPFIMRFLNVYLWSKMTDEVHTISFQTFFVWALFLIVHTWNYSRVRNILLRCNAFVVPFQQLLQGPMEVLLCERVNDLRQRLFYLLNCLITTASELKEKANVTGSKVWTIGTVRNCLDAHLTQIVCKKDGVVDWCIVLVEMPLGPFEECWPLPTESLPELS